MSLKRKALADAVSGRSSKRSTPAPSEPVSLDSDDDYYGSDARSQDNGSSSEKEHIRKARARLDFSSFQGTRQKHKPSVFGEKDFSWLSLKPDHENRPLWIDPNVSAGSKKGPKITLESFSPLSAQATDLLTTIAEPQSRPSYLHEYRFTEHSLYAALSVGLRGEDIIRALEKLSKTPVPESVIEFINRHTKTYGKVRLVLRNNKFYVESDERAIIEMLLRDPVVGPCKAEGTDVHTGVIQTKATVIQGTSNAKGMTQAGQNNREMPKDEPPSENEAMIAFPQR